MAVQMGIIPLQGTIGNINFYKRGGKYFARGKVGVDANRIAIDPKFQRSRENAAEFGAAFKATKLLRTAFQSLVHATHDKRMMLRLTSKMISVLRADTKSPRGMRKVIEGNVELLEGFEFNEPGNLRTTFVAPNASDINRITGELKISIPPFNPLELVTAPPAATHFKFFSAGGAIDFENNSCTVDVHSGPELLLNDVQTEEIVFNNIVPANSTHTFFLLLGVEFIQQVNAAMYPLKDRSFNALAIVKVSTL
jgi:hypothetical protein